MEMNEERSRMSRAEYEAKWGEPFEAHRMIVGEPSEQDCDCLLICLSEESDRRAALLN